MDEEKKGTSYESFREAAEAYGDDKGHDLLTDPAAMAAAEESAAGEEAISHGQRIRAGRESRGFTLEELAEKTGIESRVLAQLEAGETYLPLGQLIKLSKALSLKMSDVISTGNEPFTIVRSDRRQSFARFGKAREDRLGYEYESLAPNKRDRVMEP
ncbi:MAG: helix-turn-helix transcriptional regulator, partial [Desulfomonilaceae bacterium]|nr:helix-turn-helix transcriptional regulator [Desulfomonilaceae bacterium]